MNGTETKVNTTDTSIRVDDLDFAYLRDPVLRGVSFTLERGAVGLLGPNGSGKTTLLRGLLGHLLLPTGKVRVLGQDVARNARRVRGRLGWMPERGGIIPGTSGVALVAYMGELAGMPARDAMQRAHEVLHYVGLADERYRPCEKYSQGMKQRLKLATALVHDPVWLLLDEPTSGLDPKGRVAILDLVADLARRKGLGIILSTHLLADVESVCREILVLRKGRLLAHRSVESTSQATRLVFEVEGFGDEAAFVERLEREAEQVTRDKRRIFVTLDFSENEGATADCSPAAAGVRLIASAARDCGYAPRRLRPRPVSLADEFYRLVEE